MALIPGVSPSVAAITARLGAPSCPEEFLVSIAGVNTANALFSLVALYVIDNPRSGAAAAIQELMALDQSTLIQMIIKVVIALNGDGFLPGVPYPNPFLLDSPFS
jgi:putative membrane protein